MILILARLSLLAFFVVLSTANAEELTPTPSYKLVKLLNETGQNVDFTYQFETSQWSYGSVPAGGSVFFYESNPEKAFRLNLDINGRRKTYALKTNEVYADLRGDVTAFKQRNDQAEIYHLAYDKAGSVVVYQGLPSSWAVKAANEFARRLSDASIDVGVFARPLDSASGDMLVAEVEFRAASSILGEVYARWMRTKETPNIAIQWTKQPSGYLKPNLSIRNCQTESGAKFLKHVLSSVIGSNPEWHQITATYTCSVESFVLAPNVLDKFMNGRKLRFERVLAAFTQYMNTQTSLPADHSHERVDGECRICSVWDYSSQRRSRYRWKAMVTFGQTQHGEVKLDTRIVAQKLINGRWDGLSSFHVHSFGEVGAVGFDPATSRDGDVVSIKQGSPAARLATNVSVRLGKILTGE